MRDDGLVCYGFPPQVGRIDTRDYLLCGQIGSFMRRRRGSGCMTEGGEAGGIDLPRKYTRSAVRYTAAMCNIQFRVPICVRARAREGPNAFAWCNSLHYNLLVCHSRRITIAIFGRLGTLSRFSSGEFEKSSSK